MDNTSQNTAIVKIAQNLREQSATVMDAQEKHALRVQRLNLMEHAKEKIAQRVTLERMTLIRTAENAQLTHTHTQTPVNMNVHRMIVVETNT